MPQGLVLHRAKWERGLEVSARHPGTQGAPPPAIQAGVTIPLLFVFS